MFGKIPSGEPLLFPYSVVVAGRARNGVDLLKAKISHHTPAQGIRFIVRPNGSV